MKEITLAAVVKNIPFVTAFIDEELQKVGCPLKIQLRIDVAVDEIFTNIASYAYPGGEGEATVRFELDELTRTASIVFEDRGIPYDPMKKEDPDVTLSAEEREIGGLGIYMVKKTMDDMYYERRDGWNILTIRKHIG